jgi:hypothetical protein
MPILYASGVAVPPLEVRRLAIAAALHVVSREPLPVREEPPAAVEATLETLTAQIAEVLKRLDSVETALLESVWERETAQKPAPASEPVTPTLQADCAVSPGRPMLPPVTTFPAEDDATDVERLSVPAVPLSDVRMSNRAAKALFGE